MLVKFRVTNLVNRSAQCIFSRRTRKRRVSSLFAVQSSLRYRTVNTMTDELAEVETKFGSLSEYSLQLNRWFLKPIGAWPELSSSPRREKIMSYIIIIICFCISLFTIIPGMLYIIYEEQDIYLKLKIFGPLSHWCGGSINYIALLLRKNEIHHCIVHMQTDWKIITRIADRKIMLKKARIARSIAGYTAAFMHSGIFCTCIILGAVKQTVIVGNETMKIYSLPCPPYKIPIDTNPMHDIVLVTQFISGFIVSSSAVGAFSLAAVFSNHVLGQLNVMTSWIDEFVNQPVVGKRNTCIRISVIVEHHLRILSLIARIEHTMTRICFTETFKCMLGMCMPTYYFLAEWSQHNVQNLLTYVMIVISMTFNIFLVCYIGESLAEQCEKIGEKVYMTNWYQLPEKDILNLVMIMLRSSMKIKITAGKLITMSIYTFGSIIRTVFAYLNMLRQTTMT